MSKADLKAAMTALNISIPYNLSKSTPSFTFPTLESSIVDQDFKPSQQIELSPDDGPSQDSRPHPKPEPSPKSKPRQTSRSACNRASKREIFIPNEKGELEKLNKKEIPAQILVNHLTLTSDGYGTLSNRILDILFQADFDKAEIEILLFMIRESIFWRQEWTDPMSSQECENFSGISKSSLWTHLRRLTDKNWLERELVKAGGKSQARNRYRLNPIVWGPLLPKRKQEPQEIEPSPENKPSQHSNTSSGQESKSPSPSENQTESSLYKNISSNPCLNTSLSQAPEALEIRWSKMLDKGAGEREVFFKLLELHGRPVWDHCVAVVDHLIQNGDLRKKPVGSPFGLLAQGTHWELFLSLVLAKKEKSEALQRAKEATPLVGSYTTQAPAPCIDEPKTPPPAGFLDAIRHRQPKYTMTIFQGDYSDMEMYFVKRLPSKTEQWTEIRQQLGSNFDLLDSDKARWIAGIQRWFKRAWDSGDLAA